MVYGVKGRKKSVRGVRHTPPVFWYNAICGMVAGALLCCCFPCNAGTKADNTKLYAKRTEIITVSAADAATVIAALTAEKSPCTVVLIGALDTNTLAGIKTALTTAGGAGAKVALDMSACTGLTSLPPSAFSGCSSLTSVTIPGSVTKIGETAFDGCSSLTSVRIPDSVTEIEREAFYDCSSLTDISVDKSNTVYKTIDGVLFTKNGERLVCYPAGKTDTSYVIPDIVTFIGGSAFSGCSSLTSVTIPDTVTEIWSSAFENCTSLASVTIPDTVTEIGDGAFSGCSSLTSVTIPDTVIRWGGTGQYHMIIGAKKRAAPLLI